MSHRSVELVIGRLATDEEFRRRFEASRGAALDEVVTAGLPLTPVERRALVELDLAACKRFATCVSRRSAYGTTRPDLLSRPQGGDVMNGYDDRGTTLDPGLTALALRARARADETYAFVEWRGQPAWWQRAWAAANRPLWLPRGLRAAVDEAA